MARQDFLPELHTFRAFAIVNIMLAHVWFVPPKHGGLPGAGLVKTAREVLFHDSTIYFIFISGFLARWLAARTPAGVYWRKKALYVLVPYLLFTLLYLAEWATKKGAGLDGFLERLPGALVHGDARRHLWYLPFIFPVFAATPLLVRLPARIVSVLAMVAVLLPLLGTRTGTNVTIGQYVFLAPAYLLGMYAATDYPAFLARLRPWRWGLLAAGLAATAFLAASGVGKREFGFVNLTESVFWVQKLGFSLFFLDLFSRWRERDLPLVSHLATCSFGLYFLHFFVAHNPASRGLYSRVLGGVGGGVIPISLAYAAAACAISLGLVMAARRLLGRWSRPVIGS